MYIDDFTKLLLKLDPPSILGVAVMLGVKVDNTDGETILCNILEAYEKLNRKKRKTLIWLLRKATQSDRKDHFWNMVYKIGRNGDTFRATPTKTNSNGAAAEIVSQSQKVESNGE